MYSWSRRKQISINNKIYFTGSKNLQQSPVNKQQQLLSLYHPVDDNKYRKGSDSRKIKK